MKEQNESTLEKIVAEPVVLLDDAITEVQSIEKKLITKTPFRAAKEYFNTLGPGLTTGAADDDPAGIATYSQAGAQFGYKFLWLSWFSFPLMAVVQEMCARIGIVTGKGLAANIKTRFSKKILVLVTMLLFFANTLNIAADLGAMAEAVQLLIPKVNNVFIIVLFAFSTLLLQIYTTYARYAKYLKYAGLTLLAYVVSAILANLDWSAIAVAARTPQISFSKESLFLICAILGTTISPYLFFWQTSQEVEEQQLEPKNSVPDTKKTLRRMRTDVWSGMFFSNAIMFFIIAACAGVLHQNGITNITSAAQAAEALRPFAGDFAYTLFAIGIIGVGMLAVPVLAGSSAYALSEAFGWKTGLYRKAKEAGAFYGVIFISMVLGIVLNLFGIDAIHMLIYSAIGNGLIAPVVLVCIVLIASDKAYMREHRNKKYITMVGWATVGIMVLVGSAAIYSLL